MVREFAEYLQEIDLLQLLESPHIPEADDRGRPFKALQCDYTQSFAFFCVKVSRLDQG